MKIKALIITATLVVASVASSMAQVYSANAVGYVNMSLPGPSGSNPAGLSLIANPLMNGDNAADAVLPLGDDAIGTIIYRFADGAYTELTSLGSAGWYAEDPAKLFLPVGEGFFIACLVPLNITFVGDVMQGDLSNPIPGDGTLSIRASQVPQEAKLGHIEDLTGAKSGLEFPAADGDTVYMWNPPGYITWQYANGLGWVNADEGTVDPDGPLMPVGGAFWVAKIGTGVQNWTRSFSVN